MKAEQEDKRNEHGEENEAKHRYHKPSASPLTPNSSPTFHLIIMMTYVCMYDLLSIHNYTIGHRQQLI